MKLRQMAHARTGDKGDISNIVVIAYREQDYALLCERLSAERVQAFFQPLLAPHDSGAAREAQPARRYEVPGVLGLNFVLPGLLRGGVTRSLALDAHGKTLAAALLDIDI